MPRAPLIKTPLLALIVLISLPLLPQTSPPPLKKRGNQKFSFGLGNVSLQNIVVFQYEYIFW